MATASEGDDESVSFKGNFTAEGVATLKARIEDKLKDFMGDYTDDTLVVSAHSLSVNLSISLSIYMYM